MLLAQSADFVGTTLATRADHAGHAELHRPGPADAGIELAAMEQIGLADDVTLLCHAAKVAMTIGLMTDPARDSARLAWFRAAEAYALRARALRPEDPEALFMEAAALGLQAGHMPLGDRIKTANLILEKSRRILELDPDHAGGHHLIGRLTAEGMRVNPMIRFLVARVFGGAMLREASWEDAEASLRAALAAEPGNPMHHLELAYLLEDTGRADAARRHLRQVLAHPDASPLIAYYKDAARTALGRLD